MSRSPGPPNPICAYSSCASAVCSSQRTFANAAPVDDLADDLLAEPAAAMLRQDVDVGEVRDRMPVRDGAREADLAPRVVDANNARRAADERLDRVAGPPLGPVRLLGQVAMHLVDVDTLDVVVQLVPVRKLPRHRAAVSHPAS